MHDNCLWVALAPHLSFSFCVLSLVISCIGVSIVVGTCMWGVFVLVLFVL